MTALREALIRCQSALFIRLTQEVLTPEEARETFELKLAQEALDASGQTDWRELCRRLYVELFACNQQMTGGTRPRWTEGKEVRDVLADAKAALDSEPLHADDLAVYAFAQAMREKLAQARAKGRDGWQTCPPDELSRMLREHVEKGDPRDVANFCMFLWSLGYRILGEPIAVDHTKTVCYAAPEDLVDDGNSHSFYVHQSPPANRDDWVALRVNDAAAPQPQQAEQQGCADANDLAKAAEILRSNGQVKLAERLRVAALTAEQPRQMVALTDEDIAFCIFQARVGNGPFKRDGSTAFRLARAAIAKFCEVNGVPAPGGKE